MVAAPATRVQIAVQLHRPPIVIGAMEKAAPHAVQKAHVGLAPHLDAPERVVFARPRAKSELVGIPLALERSEPIRARGGRQYLVMQRHVAGRRERQQNED